MDKKTQHMHNAAKLMRQQHSGVLSTLSLSLKGYPFASVTPFLMTETGDIVIYASDIAQHSRNMKNNDKVSLCIYDGAQSDSQANARVTLIGNAMPDEVNESLQAQYMQVFPQARAYVEAHDFRFYLISTYKVRYIGGFGEIYWFSQDEWQSIMYSLSSAAQGAIAHMHEDHGDALAEIVGQQLQVTVSDNSVKMLSCFQHGFHFRVTNNRDNSMLTYTIGFVPFVNPISEDYDLRKAMVDLTKLARKAGQTLNLKPSKETRLVYSA